MKKSTKAMIVAALITGFAGAAQAGGYGSQYNDYGYRSLSFCKTYDNSYYYDKRHFEYKECQINMHKDGRVYFVDPCKHILSKW